MSAPSFRLEYSPSAPVARAPESVFLATNHLNLLYMLAAGLVMPPSGFAGKHYHDPLATFPGWIPLFIGRIPAVAIQQSTEEAPHLRPVIAAVRLRDIAGTVHAAIRGRFRKLRFPEQFSGLESVLLVPAPLPISRITSIVFPSIDERSAFMRDAGDFNNVAVKGVRLEIRRKHLFNKASPEAWPPSGGPGDHKAPLFYAQAAGGVIAMLQHVANRGELSVRACRHAFDPDSSSMKPAENPLIAGLSAWMRSGAPPPSASADLAVASVPLDAVSETHLLWGAVERLVDSRRDPGQSAVESVLLEYLLRAAGGAKPRSPTQERMHRLRATLEALMGLGGVAPSEAFERHQSPAERASILFCMRRRCSELLEFRSEQLAEADWLAAAILFGAREGWLGLPAQLRDVPGLSASIVHRMATTAHRLAGTDLELGSPPARVRPLRELLDPTSQWRTDSRRHAAALTLARAMKWDCIGTRMSFPRGEYELTRNRGSLHLDLPARYTVAKRGQSVRFNPATRIEVVPMIERKRFFDLLAETRLDRRAEAKVRKVLDQPPPCDAK